MRICVWPKSWSLSIRRPRALGERPSPRICDLHARNLDYMSAGHHALGLRCRKSSAHQLNHLIDRDTMCEQDGLGAAVTGCGKQGKRAVAVGPRVLLGHGSMYGVVIEKIGRQVDSGAQPCSKVVEWSRFEQAQAMLSRGDVLGRNESSSKSPIPFARFERRPMWSRRVRGRSDGGYFYQLHR